MTTIIIAISLLFAWYVYKRRKDGQLYRMWLHFNKGEEFKRTLCMGIYYRFMKQQEGEKVSSSFIRQTPLEFEVFAAQIIEKVYGGICSVTSASGDFGVDIEHRVNGKIFYGQCKVYCTDLPFNSIALIHSNMVKHGAEGGYIITTSAFSANAKKYAQGLNIELIDGPRIAELYMKSLETEQSPQYVASPVN